MLTLKYLDFFKLEELLAGIEKPGRYIDHEYLTRSKSLSFLKENPDTLLSALVFPDIYDVGMPNLGLQILYEIINKETGFSAERVFSPWLDFEQRLREENVKIFSLENRIFLDCFDLIGFGIAHEMLYTNVLNIIDLAGLEVRCCNRKKTFPLICAGGASAVNPWPLSKFIDFFVIGDGEEKIIEILKLIQSFKKDITEIKENNCKNELLDRISSIEGVFVPAFYKIYYRLDGKIKKIEPDKKIKKAVFKRFSSGPILNKPVIPSIKVVHDRLNIEIMRGCSRGCRFCQAGFIYRPVRQRPVEELVNASIEGIKKTGYDEISFTSLSTSDYRGLGDLIDILMKRPEFNNTSISLPSLRLDSFGVEVAAKIGSKKKPGLTFAPESGSQRMRNIIKKDINEEDIFDVMKLIFGKGWNRVKLYFMVGLPFEKKEDIDCISLIIKRVVTLARKILPKNKFKRFKLSISINGFCPKPFTPFQWCSQDLAGGLNEKIRAVSEKTHGRFIKLNYTNPEKSEIECAMARGDDRIPDVIEKAWKLGARFDNWTDCFKYDLWIKAFRDSGIDIAFYTTRQIGANEALPWDIIDIGVKKEFFIREYKKAAKMGLDR